MKPIMTRGDQTLYDLGHGRGAIMDPDTELLGPPTSIASLIRLGYWEPIADAVTKSARTLTISSGGKARDAALNPIVARVRQQLIDLVALHSNRNKRDVSDEERDAHGEWTAGGGTLVNEKNNSYYRDHFLNTFIAQQAAKHGLAPSEYEKQANAHLKDLMGKASVRIRVPVSAATKILDDGRFKSQFESQKSGGMYSPNSRAQSEEVLFGIPKDIPAAQRPIYGYIEESTDREKFEGTQQYGEVAFTLKPDVEGRTSFTWDDSLSYSNSAASTMASPTLDGIAQIGDRTDDVLNLKSIDNRFTSYIEAQVHDGVSLKDVASVRIDSIPYDFIRPSGARVGTGDTGDIAALTDKLDAANIPWEVHDSDTNRLISRSH